MGRENGARNARGQVRRWLRLARRRRRGARSALRMVRSGLTVIALVVGAITAIAAGALAASGPAPSPGMSSTTPDPGIVPPQSSDSTAARQEGYRNSAAGRNARAGSRQAFRNQAAPDALATARKHFPDSVDSPPLAWPPLVAGERVSGYLNGHTGVVAEPSGRRGVLESTLPLRGKTPAGGTAPLDLALTDAGSSAYAPKSAAAAVRIPKDSHGELRFPDQSFGVSLDGAAAQPAALSSNKAFFANVVPDGDLVLEPQPVGAELSFVLRSPAAPSSLALRFDLASGQRLQLADGAGPDPLPPGSAEVVDGSRRVASIAPATAVDAQGQTVPVSYRIDGDRLVIALDTSGDLAWPVLVDPPIAVYDNNGTSVPSTNTAGYTWKNWTPTTYYDPNLASTWSYCNNAGSNPSKKFYFCKGSLTGTSFDGGPLFVKGNSTVSYAGGEWAEWIKPALVDPDGRNYTYITQFHAANLGHQPNRSKWFAGVWSPTTGSWETGKVLAGNLSTLSPSYAYYETTGSLTSTDTRYLWVRNGLTSDPIPPGNIPAFGIKMTTAGVPGSPVPFASVGGGATMTSENYAPTLDAPTHSVDPPAGWVESYSDSVSVSAHDRGLGMGTITVGGPNLSATRSACTQNGGPTGAQNLYDACALDLTVPATSYSAPEGTSTYTATATDLVNNRAQDQIWRPRVDRSPPNSLDLSGGSMTGQDNQPVDGAYSLNFNTTDQYAGIRAAKLFIDDMTTAVDSRSQQPACNSTSGCPSNLHDAFGVDFNARAPDGTYRFGEGLHTVNVSSEDPLAAAGAPVANHVTSRSFTVLIDRTAPALTLSGSLKDSAGGVVHEGSYGLTAVAADGTTQTPGAGIKNVDFLVDGISQIQSSACDQGSTTRTCNFTLDTSRLTDGPHEVRVVASDRLDHQQEQHFSVELAPRTGERDSTYTFDEHRLSDGVQLDVNLGNGNAWVKTTDFDFSASQLDLTFDRVVNTVWTKHAGDFGPGMTGTFGATVRLRTGLDGSRLLELGDGSVIRFTRNSDGSYSTVDGADLTLADQSDGTATVTYKESSSVYTFTASGRLSRVTDPEGQQLQFGYNGDGTMASITGGAGPATSFTFDSSKRVTRIDRGSDVYTYGYTADGLLGVATAPGGVATRYAYDPMGRLARVTLPDGSSTKLGYDSLGRVTSVTQVTDEATDSGPTTSYSYGSGQTVMTDSSNRQSTYVFDDQLRLMDTSASPLPSDYEECMADHDDQLYCQNFDRESSALPDVNPVYNPEPDTSTDELVPNTSVCQSEFGLDAVYCLDTPVDDPDLLGGVAAPLPGGGTTTASNQPITDEVHDPPFQFGMADFGAVWDWRNFDDPRFQALHVNAYRAVVPFNVALNRNSSDACQSLTWRQWRNAYQKAVDQNLSIMVAFGRVHCVSRHRAETYLPSDKAYLKAVREFRRQFPRVKWIAPWNEPNHPSQPTSTRNKRFGGSARRAAHYTYLVQRHICQASSNCRAVGAELAVTGHWVTYLNSYISELQDPHTPNAQRGVALPTKWGVHPYSDLREAVKTDGNGNVYRTGRTPAIDQFRDRVAGLGKVWFSEVGSFVHGGSTTYSTQEQAEEVRYLVDDLALREGAQRIFYWAFWDPRGQTDRTFDTMLVKMPPSDTNTGDPSYQGYPAMTKYPVRPAYDVYRCYHRGSQQC